MVLTPVVAVVMGPNVAPVVEAVVNAGGIGVILLTFILAFIASSERATCKVAKIAMRFSESKCS